VNGLRGQVDFYPQTEAAANHRKTPISLVSH
jgi:hypothetical protein